MKMCHLEESRNFFLLPFSIIDEKINKGQEYLGDKANNLKYLCYPTFWSHWTEVGEKPINTKM